MKVVIATPTIKKPFDAYLASLEASVPALDAAGIEHQTVFEIGCPYISHARARMIRKALDAKADIIVCIDHDMAWEPQDLVNLIQAKGGDVFAGTYRYKKDEEEYMGTVQTDSEGRPMVRADGCIAAEWVPAGFLRITKEAIASFMRAYPELVFGPPYNPSIDLFNHGAHKGLWYGEDYAFSRNYAEKCGPIWLLPNLNLTHYSRDENGNEVPHVGNFHRYLLRRPGGSESDCPRPPKSLEERVAALKVA